MSEEIEEYVIMRKKDVFPLFKLAGRTVDKEFLNVATKEEMSKKGLRKVIERQLEFIGYTSEEISNIIKYLPSKCECGTSWISSRFLMPCPECSTKEEKLKETMKHFNFEEHLEMLHEYYPTITLQHLHELYMHRRGSIVIWKDDKVTVFTEFTDAPDELTNRKKTFTWNELFYRGEEYLLTYKKD